MHTSETALLTGATGFLGRQVARELSQAGWSVVGIATRARENAPMEHLTAYHALHLPSPELEAVVRSSEPSVCIHCAGRASVDLSMTEPGEDFRAAVGVTQDLLEALRRFAPDCRLVYVSSAAVYGQPDRLPVSEDQPLNPISPYGFHRILCERLCAEYAAVYGLATISARVFSAYGPGLRRQLLWDVCRRALTESELVLRGTGDETRDFIHGRDVARALIALAERGAGRGEAVNVATGTEQTVRSVATAILEEMRVDTPLRFDGAVHAGNPTHWRADISALNALGFAGEVPFDAGVAAYAAWCRAEIRGF